MDPSKKTQPLVQQSEDREDVQEPQAATPQIMSDEQRVRESRQSGQDDFIALQDQEGYASPMRATAQYRQREDPEQLAQDDLTVRRPGVTHQASDVPAGRPDTLMRRQDGQDSASVLEATPKRDQESQARDSQRAIGQVDAAPHSKLKPVAREMDDEEFRARIEKETLLNLNQDIDDVDEEEEQQQLKALKAYQESSPSPYKALSSAKFEKEKSKQGTPASTEKRESEQPKKQKSPPRYLKPTVETQLKDLRIQAATEESQKSKQQIAEQQKTFPNVYYSKANLLATPVQMQKQQPKPQHSLHKIAQMELQREQSQRPPHLKKVREADLGESTAYIDISPKLVNFQDKYLASSRTNKSPIKIVSQSTGRDREAATARQPSQVPQSSFAVSGDGTQQIKQRSGRQSHLHEKEKEEIDKGSVTFQQTYQTEQPQKIMHPGRHRIHIQNTQKKETQSTRSPNVNSVAQGTEDGQQTIEGGYSPSLGIGRQDYLTSSQEFDQLALDRKYRVAPQSLASEASAALDQHFLVSPETMEHQIQLLPPSRRVLRIKEIEDYKVKALHNHTRRNFEENENVTMFVGSVDHKRQQKVNQHEKELSMVLRQQRELEKHKEISKLKFRSQMDLRKAKNKHDVASQKEQQELLESEKSFELKGDTDGLLFNIGKSAGKKQQENRTKDVHGKQRSQERQNKRETEWSSRKDNKIMQEMKKFLRYNTPRHQLKKLDLYNMDERSCIEQVSQLKNQLQNSSRTKPNGRFGQAQSLSPPGMKHNLMMKSTNLKFFVNKNSTGNQDDMYSQTTRIISGHNTPLPYLQKTRDKYLTKINKDQDDLMMQLKQKQRRLECRSLNASRLFVTFQSKMEQTDTYDPDIEEAIHKASQQFHSAKMKPMHSMHSIVSFSQRRAEIERQLELGYSFKSGRSSSQKSQRKTNIIGFLRDVLLEEEIKREPGSQAKSLGQRSHRSLDSQKQRRQSQRDSKLSTSSKSIDMDDNQDHERLKEKELEERAERYFSDGKLKDFGEKLSPSKARRNRLVAKIRENLRKKAKAKENLKASIAARTFDPVSAMQQTESSGQERLMTGASRESETTYSKDSIAILEKSRVNKYNKDHQFNLLNKSKQWIKTQRELRKEAEAKKGDAQARQSTEMFVQERSREYEDEEEQDDVVDAYDLEDQANQQSSLVEDGHAGEQAAPSFSKQRIKHSNVNIITTLSTKGRTQRGPEVGSSDGQQPNSLSHTIIYSQQNTHDFLSNSKEKARPGVAYQEIQEAEERSLVTHQQQSEPSEYKEIEQIARLPKDSQQSLEVDQVTEAQRQRFNTLNPINLQTDQKRMFASSTNNSLAQGQPTPMDPTRVDTAQVMSYRQIGSPIQDLPQIAEVTSQDQMQGQNFMQIGIDEYQDPEVLKQRLLDEDVPAAEKAFIKGRLINMNKPKTAGASRNMGKKKLSTVPGKIANERIISGSGVSSGMFFEKTGHQKQDSNMQTQQAAFPESTLLSGHQPGETDSHTKTGQGSQIPTLTRSYSVWKENFALRKDIGYQTYQRLPKDEKNQIMQQLNSERNLLKKKLRREARTSQRAEHPSEQMSPADAERRHAGMDERPKNLENQDLLQQRVETGEAQDGEDPTVSEDAGENIDLRIPINIRRQTSGDIQSFEAQQHFASSSRSRQIASVHKSLEIHNRRRRKIPTFATTRHTAFDLYEEQGGLPGKRLPDKRFTENGLPVPDPPVSTQRDQLYQQYKLLAEEHDNRLIEGGFIDNNIAKVADPSCVRMASSAAARIHEFRSRQRSAREALRSQEMCIQETQFQDPELKGMHLAQNLKQQALRQCECHIEPKKQLFVRNTDGIVNRENRHRYGINSRPYDSLQQQMDLRLKPQFQVQRTQKMLTYFMQADGLQAEKYIPLKSMVPLDDMQEMNLQANSTANIPLGNLMKVRPSSVSTAQGFKSVRPPSKREPCIWLDLEKIEDADRWYMGNIPIQKEPTVQVEVKSSNSGSKHMVKKATPTNYQEDAERGSRTDSKIHHEEHLPTLLAILNRCGDGDRQPDWRQKRGGLEEEAAFDRLKRGLREDISTANELDAALTIYLDKEKVEQDNIRDKLEKLQQEPTDPEGKQPPSNGTTVRSPKSEMVTKRPAQERHDREQEEKRKEDQRRMEQATADQKLHSLKDIYMEMKRNSDLDHENFLRPDVIQQCIDDKYTVSEYVQTKCKARRPRPNYARAITSRFERLQLGRKSEGPPANAACQAWQRNLGKIDGTRTLNRGFQDNYKINNTQFIAATKDYLKADRAEAIFKNLNFDKSGVVTQTNLKKGFNEFGRELSEQDIKSILEQRLKHANQKMIAKEPKLRTRMRTQRSRGEQSMVRDRQCWPASSLTLRHDTMDPQEAPLTLTLSDKLRTKIYGLF